MRKYILTWIFFVLYVSSFMSQDRTKDSLENIIKAIKEDTTKIRTYNKLIKQIAFTGNYRLMFEFATKMQALIEKVLIDSLKMDHEYILEANRLLGNSHSYAGSALQNIGNFPEAIKKYYEALKIYEAIHLNNGVASIYGNIGIVNELQGDYNKALKNHILANKISLQNGKKSFVTISYNNLGNVYNYLQNYPLALKNYSLALETAKEENNKYIMATTYANIANVYSNRKEYDKALENHFVALKMKEQNKDVEGVCLSNINISVVYEKTNNFAKAILYSTKALELSQEIQNKDNMKEIYGVLSTVYTKMAANSGNGKTWQTALMYYKKFISYRDSLNNEESTKKIVETEMNYEFNKKVQTAKAEQDKKDVVAAEEKQKQKITIASISVGLFLVLILAFVIFRSLRQNQKKNKIISEQKEIVEKQKEEAEEKQKEILDSIYYARRIQRALITPEKYIESSLKRLIS